MSKLTLTEETAMPLLMACAGLLAYWKRTRPNYYQCEKIQDHMDRIQRAIDAIEGESKP